MNRQPRWLVATFLFLMFLRTPPSLACQAPTGDLADVASDDAARFTLKTVRSAAMTCVQQIRQYYPLKRAATDFELPKMPPELNSPSP